MAYVETTNTDSSTAIWVGIIVLILLAVGAYFVWGHKAVATTPSSINVQLTTPSSQPATPTNTN